MVDKHMKMLNAINLEGNAEDKKAEVLAERL